MEFSANLASQHRSSFGCKYLQRQANREAGSSAFFALHNDAASHHLAETLTDHKAESGPSVLLGGGRIGLGEWLEEPLELRLGHPDPAVFHADYRAILFPARVDHNHSIPCEFRGIAH